MTETRLRFDFTNSMAYRVGMRSGVTEDELNVMTLKMPNPVVLSAKTLDEGRPGFLAALDPDAIKLEDIRATWARFESGFNGGMKDLLVLGIGGSALCTLTYQAALAHPYANALPDGHPKRAGSRVHVIDNADPWQLEGVLDLLDPKSTGVFVVSKSGTTAETLCGFGRVREWLGAGGADWKKATAVCTDFPDERATALWSFAEQHGLAKVGQPVCVGGRFAAFTAVGLFPALAMGINIDELLAGAHRMADRCRESDDVMTNPAFLAAAIQYAYFTRPQDRRRTIVVLMPYAYRLRLVADWFAQLWAESLGKRRGLDGSRVNCGQTPVKALGATDQHSQLQLYQEGPHDKVIVFLRVLDHGTACPVPALEMPVVKHLGERDLGALLDAEYRATAFALAEANRPNMTIELPEVSAGTIGELLMFFMIKTAIAGELFRIDAFDQPGVEASKRAAHALCGREGEQFDELRELIADAEAGQKTVL